MYKNDENGINNDQMISKILADKTINKLGQQPMGKLYPQ